MDEEAQPNPNVNRPSAQRIHEILDAVETAYPLEIIVDPDDPLLESVAALDAGLFGPHKSLSREDFSELVEKGAVVYAHRDGEALISEATLVFNKDPEGDSSLERGLPSWLGYCDGAAVAENYRGKGLQRELLQARELTAKEAGKEATGASVRHRNLASIRSMLRSGYVMIADAPSYYGEGIENDRVVMLKDFSFQNQLEALRSDSDALEDSLQGMSSIDELDELLSKNTPLITLGVEQNDAVDSSYNQAVAKLLRNGYIGVSCHDLDVGDSDGERSNAMVFVLIDSMQGVKDSIRAKQQEVQTLLDTA